MLGPRLRERREQSEQLKRVETAFFVLRVADSHVLFAPTEVHGLSEDVLGRRLAKVLAGAVKQKTKINK